MAIPQSCSVKKLFLEISQNSQESTCARVPQACNFIKKETLAQLFSCEFAKFLRTPFLTEQFRWLLLQRTQQENVRINVFHVMLRNFRNDLTIFDSLKPTLILFNQFTSSQTVDCFVFSSLDIFPENVPSFFPGYRKVQLSISKAVTRIEHL